MTRRHPFEAALGVGVLALLLVASTPTARDSKLSDSLRRGTATPESISVVTFAPDGTLFVGNTPDRLFDVETPADASRGTVAAPTDTRRRPIALDLAVAFDA